MSKRGKSFDLLDFPKFSRPNVFEINTAQTAAEFTERLFGGGFMSYGQIWPKLPLLFKGFASEQEIELWFKSYRDEWKNESIRDVVRHLRKLFGGKGNFYPIPSKPIYVLGMWFKPSIKGYWFFEGRTYAVLINPRKGQPLSNDDVQFLARAVYELHCVDDPNDPIPLIVDVSELAKGEGRVLRPFALEPSEIIDYSIFEASVRDFLKALNTAGVALPAPADGDILDLFKKR